MCAVASSAPFDEPVICSASASRDSVRPLSVVVPFYNEERYIGDTLQALSSQADRDFSLVLVDNGSSDDSTGVVSRWMSSTTLDARLIAEPEKGTGCAADRGFRYAIAHGARWVARTDADCLPRPDWVGQLRRALDSDGLEFVAGVIRPRADEMRRKPFERALLMLIILVASISARVRHRGREFRYPFFLVAGNNLAITSSLYARAGGFPRTSIEEQHEDLALAEAVRRLTARAAHRGDAVVYNSARRVRAYGYINTLRWYRNHGYRGGEVDVR